MGGSWTTFPANLLAALIAALLAFLLGLFWPVIPKSYQQYHVRRFWGKGVLGQDFVITYGGFLNSRINDLPPTEFWYVKRYHDGRQFTVRGPREHVVADAEIRSASYIINTLSKYRKTAVAVMIDATAFANLNRTFVSIGSSSTNEITDLILREENNTFLEFRQEDRTFLIRDKKSDEKFLGFQDPVRKDLGIVLKIPNLRFPGHFFFVCAGLGEWGTSGASWYLAAKWRDLESEFDDSFGIVVEVEPGSDESARRIFP